MADITFQYIINKMFPNGLADATFDEATSSFAAMVRKNPDGLGDSFEVAVQHSAGGGRSSDFAKAQTNDNGPRGKKFRVYWADDYARASIPAKDMLAAKKKGGGAIVDLVEHRIGTAIKKVKRSIGHGLAGDGSGVFGVINAAVGGTTTSGGFTLGTFSVTDRRGLVFLEDGDVCGSWTARKGGTADTGTFIVDRINRTLGQVSYRTNTGWAPTGGRHLAIDGDYGVKMLGLSAWLPSTDPSPGEDFAGVDRSVDRMKLAGVRVDMTAYNHEEALTQGMEEFNLYGAETSHVFTSPFDFHQLETILGARKVIVDVPNEFGLGLKGIRLANGATILPDRWIPKGAAYPLNLDTWELVSLDEAPHLVMDDGLKMARVSNADAFEARIRLFGNLKCEDPSQNGVILLQNVAG